MMLDSALVARICCLALLVRERLWVNFLFCLQSLGSNGFDGQKCTILPLIIDLLFIASV